jgi:tripartite-type tricarboxylate transporter receptor subunit TctC
MWRPRRRRTGYTIGMGQASNLAIDPSHAKMPFDPLKDFSPIASIAGRRPGDE